MVGADVLMMVLGACVLTEFTTPIATVLLAAAGPAPTLLYP
jgi:hypothetical protein